MKRLLLLAVVVTGPALAARGVAQQAPGSAALDTLLREAVAKKQVPMAVAMVATAKGVVYARAEGAPEDAIFQIASMTKPITSMAVLQLVEAGRLRLDEPAATYLPDIGAIKVYDNGTLRPPKTPVTIRHLLTHTAGFGYEFMNETLFALVAKKEVPSMMAGTPDFLQAPLLFDPGARWEYGTSTDWLGRIAERVSGQNLEVLFREKIFTPLGMADSFFEVPAGKRSRVVTTYQRQPDGSLQAQPPQAPKAVTFFSGGGGLFSTAPDYMRFVRALLAGGELDGRRILSQKSVATAFSNQVGALEVRPMPMLIPQLGTDRATLTGSPDKFGFGFGLNSTASGTSRGVNTGTWAGLYNTYFWIDREKQVGAVLMSQMLPALDPAVTQLTDDFDRLVYAAMADGRWSSQ
jgi:CubicO group peptidase (beta-lactamase class C family)